MRPKVAENVQKWPKNVQKRTENVPKQSKKKPTLITNGALTHMGGVFF